MWLPNRRRPPLRSAVRGMTGRELVRVPCPKCGKGRWVAKDSANERITATRQCRDCYQASRPVPTQGVHMVPCIDCGIPRPISVRNKADLSRAKSHACRDCHHAAVAVPKRVEMVPCVECGVARPIKVNTNADIRRASKRACVECGLRARYAPAVQVDDIDEVVVQRLINGIPVTATPAERRSAAEHLARRTTLTANAIAQRVGVGYRTVERLRRSAA